MMLSVDAQCHQKHKRIQRNPVADGINAEEPLGTTAFPAPTRPERYQNGSHHVYRHLKGSGQNNQEQENQNGFQQDNEPSVLVIDDAVIHFVGGFPAKYKLPFNPLSFKICPEWLTICSMASMVFTA